MCIWRKVSVSFLLTRCSTCVKNERGKKTVSKNKNSTEKKLATNIVGKKRIKNVYPKDTQELCRKTDYTNNSTFQSGKQGHEN